MSPLRRPLLGRTRVHDMAVMATDTERSLPGSPKNRSGCRCRGPPCPDEPVGLMVRDHGRARGHIEVAGVPGNLVDAGIAQPVEAAGDRSPHLLADPPDGFPVGAVTPWLGQPRRSPDRETSPPEVETSPPGGDRRDVSTRPTGRAALGAAQLLAAPHDGDHHLNPSKTRSMPDPAQVHEARRGSGDAHGIGFLGSVGVPTPKRETTLAGRVDDRRKRWADVPRRASPNGNRSSRLLTGVAGLV